MNHCSVGCNFLFCRFNTVFIRCTFLPGSWERHRYRFSNNRLFDSFLHRNNSVSWRDSCDLFSQSLCSRRRVYNSVSGNDLLSWKTHHNARAPGKTGKKITRMNGDNLPEQLDCRIWRKANVQETTILERYSPTKPFFACVALVRPFAWVSLSLCSARAPALGQ